MTGSIIKRGEKNYLLRLSLGKDAVTGKRLYHTVTVHGTRKEAENRLRDLARDYDRGTLVSKSGKSLNEFLTEWLATAKGRLRGRTHEDYEGIWLRYIKEDFGRLPLDKITPMKIQQVYNQLVARGLSPQTVRRLHTVVNSSLKQAVRWRLLNHNPAADVDLPANRKSKVIRAMSREQALAFVAAALLHRWGMAMIFALQTGMRPEEYLALQWTDLDMERNLARVERVLVRPKGGGWKFDEPKTTGSRRIVSLDPRLVEDLRAYRAQQLQQRLFAGERWQAEWNFVFTNETGGPIFDANLLTRGFKPTLKAAGLPDFRLYDLRHTCATLLLEAGEHVKVVSERLGHASVAITMDIYSHVLPNMQEGAAQKIGDLLYSPPQPGEALPKVVSLADRFRA